MKSRQFLWSLLLLPPCLLSASCSTEKTPVRQPKSRQSQKDLAQVPGWSRQDLDFFLHGSMSTEFVPEQVLRAFIQTYPDLFQKQDLSNLGLLPDADFGWPIGFSRRQVPHLGGLSAVGINCAACHVGDVTSASSGRTVRVLGMTSHFDAEAFFGAVIVAGFRTADPANMKRFMAAYLIATDPSGGDRTQSLLSSEWQRQEATILVAMSADPAGVKGAGLGGLHQITEADLRLNGQLLAQGIDLSARAYSF